MNDLGATERAIVGAIAERRDEIVEVTSALIGFDTTARSVGDPARDERALQEYLAGRLEAIGATLDLFEPSAESLDGKPLVPPGLDFMGRPQLIATLPGAGGGRSLIFNGHIDVVPASAAEGWTSPPFSPEVRDGLLYGRGACDMKGGIAAMVVAAEVLAANGVLTGDLIVATNTDEESSGAGGVALIERGLRADAAIVTEPTALEIWTCCRGSNYATVTVPGRSGHTEKPHPDWREGGAVNAITKARVVLEAIDALGAHWAADPTLVHPILSRPDVSATVIRAGNWAVTIPGSCTIVLGAMYLPVQAAAERPSSRVEREVSEWILDYCAEHDEWLAANPPDVRWEAAAVMPFEIPRDAPIVAAAMAGVQAVGRTPIMSGLDSWFDGATLSVLGGIPSVGLGPTGLGRGGASVGHAVNEHVPVDDLVLTAQALAVSAMRFCNSAG
jgi:acetylornithine deacetylase